MSRPRTLSSLVTKWRILPMAVMLLAAIPAVPQSGNGDYMFLVGSGFLCDSGDSSTCPAVVKSAQDDSYEISGAGTFSTQGKSATGAGTFTHKTANGNALEEGIWIAIERVRFDSYGIAPGALFQRGLAFGPPLLGPKRLPMLSGSMPAGGLAVLRIRLLPMWGIPRTATLQVNCALGKVPDEHPTEGIRLAFGGSGVEYDEEVRGRVLFVLTRPGASRASKAPAPVPESGPSPAPPEAKP